LRSRSAAGTLRQSLTSQIGAAKLALRLVRALIADAELRHLGRAYLRVLRQCLRDPRLSISLHDLLLYAGHHWHFYKFYKDARSGSARIVSSFDFSREGAIEPLLEVNAAKSVETGAADDRPHGAGARDVA
jgi:hypothetical protein